MSSSERTPTIASGRRSKRGLKFAVRCAESYSGWPALTSSPVRLAARFRRSSAAAAALPVRGRTALATAAPASARKQRRACPWVHLVTPVATWQVRILTARADLPVVLPRAPRCRKGATPDRVAPSPVATFRRRPRYSTPQPSGPRRRQRTGQPVVNRPEGWSYRTRVPEDDLILDLKRYEPSYNVGTDPK